MRKWLFSIICYITAILLATYSLVGAWFLDDEAWWMTTQIFSVISSSLLLIIIGEANRPRKDDKDE